MQKLQTDPVKTHSNLAAESRKNGNDPERETLFKFDIKHVKRKAKRIAYAFLREWRSGGDRWACP